MNWAAAGLLGIVQGLTEFLPISSTAHLLLGARLLGFDDPGGLFTVMIQLGSIVAIVWLYRIKILRVVTGLPTDREARHFVLMIIVAFIPAAIAGLLFSSYVKRVLYTTPSVIAVSFVVGGIVMLMVERYGPQPQVLNADHTSLWRALGIGACQTLALIPGVSRSGGTITAGLFLGLQRTAAVRYSFLLAIPAVVAAGLFTIPDIAKGGITPVQMIVATVIAFAVGFAVIAWLLRWVAKHTVYAFVWYRIALGVLLFVALGAGWVSAT